MGPGERGDRPRRRDRPEHPGDIEPLRRQAIALGADAAALGASVFGQLLRAAPFPVELGELQANRRAWERTEGDLHDSPLAERPRARLGRRALGGSPAVRPDFRR